MAEHGAKPQVSKTRRRALDAYALAVHAAAAGRLPRTDQPALVDAGLRGRIERIERRDRRRGQRL